MPTSTVQGDLYVNGNLTAKTQNIPSAAVTDAQIASGSNVDAYKLRHLHRKVHCQPSGTAAISESRVIHEALNTGILTDFRAGAVTVPIGADTVTVDLKKNGVSVLTAVITVTSGFTTRVSQAATIATPNYANGDVFEVVTVATHTSGTLPQELWCTANFNEQSTG
jgi:hypothetical protein